MALSASTGRKKLLNLKTNNNLNSSNGFKTPKRLIGHSTFSTSNPTNLNKTKPYMNGASTKFSSLKKTANYITDQTNKAKRLEDYPSKKLKLGKYEDEQKEDKLKYQQDIEIKNENYTIRTYEIMEKDLNNVSIEELKLKEKFLDDKLKDLNAKLEKLRQIQACSVNGINLYSEIKENNHSESLNRYLSEYFKDINKLEQECADKLEGLNEWYRRERGEIEDTFKYENKKAIQEFHDKRKELKDNLKNEHEEMKKQIEIDKNTLDINMDVTEVKPPPTRNLRRRANHVNLDATIESNDVNSPLGLHVSSSVSATSGLVQSSTVLVGSSTSLGNSNLSLQTNFFSIQQAYYSSTNSLNQTLNDRKRKLTSTFLAFQLNEDDLNDDLKYLNKSLRFSNNQSPTKS